MTTPTALVTGVSGHVGQALAERLQAAGFLVRGQISCELGYGPRRTFEHTLRALVEQASADSTALAR